MLFLRDDSFANTSVEYIFKNSFKSIFVNMAMSQAYVISADMIEDKIDTATVST